MSKIRHYCAKSHPEFCVSSSLYTHLNVKFLWNKTNLEETKINLYLNYSITPDPKKEEDFSAANISGGNRACNLVFQQEEEEGKFGTHNQFQECNSLSGSCLNFGQKEMSCHKQPQKSHEQKRTIHYSSHTHCKLRKESPSDGLLWADKIKFFFFINVSTL